MLGYLILRASCGTLAPWAVSPLYFYLFAERCGPIAQLLDGCVAGPLRTQLPYLLPIGRRFAPQLLAHNKQPANSRADAGADAEMCEKYHLLSVPAYKYLNRRLNGCSMLDDEPVCFEVCRGVV